MHDDVPPPEGLLRMLTGYWVTKAIHAAAELGLADLLRDGPKTSDELASRCSVHPQALYRLLRALASVGLFAETDGRRFGLTPMAELLRSDAPDSMRALARMYGNEQYDAWRGLLDSVRTGEAAFAGVFGTSYFDYLTDNPERAAIFNEAMTGWTTQVADAVVAAYDFGDQGPVVDVGGGHGLLLATILRAHSRIRGVLFDLPHVTASAEPLLQRAGVADRCSLVGGDFFESVPRGGAFYILAQILHDWDDERCHVILANCRRAMLAEGKVLVVEQNLSPANEPSLAKWLDLHMLVLLGGRERTETEYAALFADARFELSRVVPTSSGAAIFEGVPV